MLRLLKATNSKAIECITQDKDKDSIVIRAGKNPEGKTGSLFKMIAVPPPTALTRSTISTLAEVA